MALDGGLIVGYLTAAAVGAGKRWVDRTVDSLLDRLIAVVMRRIGRGPVDRLAQNPRDAGTQREVGLMIDGAVSGDRAFAREVARLVDALDRRGGREIINNVYAQYNVQAFHHGIAVGGDFNFFHHPDPSDMSRSPMWVKVFVALGFLLAISGLGRFGYAIFADMQDPNVGGPPEGIGQAAALFFLGFVVVAIGSLGHSFSKRR